MKLQTRANAILVFAFLFAVAIACKSSGTSSSSATSNSPKNAGSVNTSTTPATSTNSATPPDIAGKYNVVGSNPDGSTYKGTLEVIPHGDVYQFRWSAGTQYDGVG